MNCFERIVIVVSGLMLLGPSPGEAAEASRGEERQLSARELVALVVSNPLGSLEVIGEERDNVALEAQYRVGARSGDRARELVEALGVDISERDGRLWLRPSRDGMVVDGLHTRLDRGDRLRMDLLLRIPHRLALEAGVTGEPLVVSGLRARVRLSSTSGEMRLTDLDGDVTANLTSGDLHAERLGGEARLTTSGGDIAVTRIGGDALLSALSGNIHAEGVAGALEVESLSGDIEVDGVGGDLRVISTNGDVGIHDVGGDLRVNNAGGRVLVHALAGRAGDTAPRARLTSSSGEVIISIHRGYGWRLDLATDSGGMRVKLPLAVEEISRRQLVGRYLDGAGSLQVVTATGDIRITLASE